MPRQHVHHALALLQIFVPKHLRHARARHDGVLHQRLILAWPARAVEHEAHHVVHFLGALRGLLPLRQHDGFRQVVDLVGDHVVHTASQRVARRRGSALLVGFSRPQHARLAHQLVFLPELIVKAVKQRVSPRNQRPFLFGNRLIFRRIPSARGLSPVAHFVHGFFLLSCLWGSYAGQGLRPCRRLPIGALRPPLSPFAPFPTIFTHPPP